VARLNDLVVQILPESSTVVNFAHEAISRLAAGPHLRRLYGFDATLTAFDVVKSLEFESSAASQRG